MQSRGENKRVNFTQVYKIVGDVEIVNMELY